MTDGISAIERIVIESLLREGKTVEQLAYDTQLPRTVTFNSLSHLMNKNLIITFNNIYFVNRKIDWNGNINKNDNLKKESKELVQALVEEHFTKTDNSSGQLVIEKCWMNQTEINIFKSMLLNIEQFLKNLAVDSLDDSNKRQQIIFWGHSNYSLLANSLLK